MHTPTPWDTDIVRDKLNYCYRIGLPTGTVEVRTDAGDEDAALIVKAVNSHAALVDAVHRYGRIHDLLSRWIEDGDTLRVGDGAGAIPTEDYQEMVELLAANANVIPDEQGGA